MRSEPASRSASQAQAPTLVPASRASLASERPVSSGRIGLDETKICSYPPARTRKFRPAAKCRSTARRAPGSWRRASTSAGRPCVISGGKRSARFPGPHVSGNVSTETAWPFPRARSTASKAASVSARGAYGRGATCESCVRTPVRRAISSASPVAAAKRSARSRMCVAWTPSRSAATAQNAASSSVSAREPGWYSSPVETPIAPASSPTRASPSIRSSSAGPGGRASSPMTAFRVAPWGTSAATFTPFPPSVSRYSPKPSHVTSTPQSELYANAVRRKSCSGEQGATPPPQFPTTTVVTPWRTALWASGKARSVKSACVCRSTKPGATTSPSASSTRAPGEGPSVPSASTRPSRTRTSARRACPPVPSTTVPP